MTKGLEALKRIKSHYNDRVCIDILEDFDLIEKELKENQERIEELEETNNLMAMREHKNTKKLKALEIIIEKNVDIVILKTTNDFTTYNELRIPNKLKEHICINDYMLTRENYYLLKEVLDYEIN